VETIAHELLAQWHEAAIEKETESEPPVSMIDVREWEQ
jgi:hypothetical protein